MRAIFFGFVLLLTDIASAASGDAIYAKDDNVRQLADTAGKRNAVFAAANSVFSGIDANTIGSFGCRRWSQSGPGLIVVSATWTCGGQKRAAAVTAAQRLDIVLAGKGVDALSTDTLENLGSGVVTATLVDAVTEAVFTVDQSLVVEWFCDRNAGTPSCKKVDSVTASPAAWLVDLRAGNVIGTIGKVP